MNARSLISICLATVSVLAGCGRDAGEFLQSGKGFLAAKDEAGALIQFKNAVDRAPDHPEARFLHARSLRRTGNPTAAETEFRKALSLGFDRVLVVPELAATLNEMGQSAKTLAETDAFQSADPSVSAEVAVLRGDALLLQGQTANARAEYARALGLAPRAPAPRVASARLALRDGDLAGAARTLEEVLRESPGHAAGLLTLATVRLKQGQAEAAVAALDRLAAAEPSDLRAYLGLVPALISLNRLDDAAERVARAARVAPGAAATRYLQALLAYRRGDREKARDLVQQSLKGGQETTAGLLLAGSIDLDLGHLASAEKALAKAVASVPDDPQARQLLATCYLRMRLPDKARQTLAPLLAEGKPAARTLALQGELALANGDARAAEHFENALRLQPGDASLRVQLGRARLLAGRIREGVADLESAAAQLGDASAEQALVEHYLRARQIPPARATAEALLRKRPDDPRSHLVAGLVHLAGGERPPAQSSFEKALALAPTFLPAAAQLARLDVARGDPKSAAQRFRTVLAREPGHPEASALLAAHLQAAHAPASEVLAILDASIATHPGVPEPLVAKAEYLISSGDVLGGLEAARAAQAMAGDDPRMLLTLGRAQQAAGEHTLAAATYGRLTLISPGSPQPLAGLAEALAAQRRWAEAGKALDRAIALAPAHLPTQLARVNLGIRAGELERARRDAQDIQKRWPRQGEGYVAEARVLAAGQDPEGAEALLRAAQGRMASASVQNALVSLLIALKRPADAERVAAAWAGVHPADHDVSQATGEAFLSAGLYKESERWLERVAEARPGRAQLLNNLAWVKGRLGKREGLGVAREALKQDPDNPVVLDTLGALQVQFGEVSEGVANLRKAVARLPAAVSIRINLARALVEAGEKREAGRVLDEASRLAGAAALEGEIATLRRAL